MSLLLCMRRMLETDEMDYVAVAEAIQEIGQLRAENKRLRAAIQFVLDKCVSEDAGNSINPFAYLWRDDWLEFKKIAKPFGISEYGGGTEVDMACDGDDLTRSEMKMLIRINELQAEIERLRGILSYVRDADAMEAQREWERMRGE